MSAAAEDRSDGPGPPFAGRVRRGAVGSSSTRLSSARPPTSGGRATPTSTCTEPPLKLALQEGTARPAQGALNHLGIQVATRSRCKPRVCA